MSTTFPDYRTAFSRLPLAVVEGAYFAHNPQPIGTANKNEMVYWLAQQVADGFVSYESVVRASPSNRTAINAGVDASKVEAATQVANRAEILALTLTGEMTQALTRLGSQAADLARLNDKIDSVKIAVDASRVDDSAIKRDVAKAIADAFAPFKQSVIDAGAESVVADVTGVHVVETKTAHDVFGVLVTDAKGNDLMVEVWNHPSAPAIDPHFVWTERILQHLLLAQDTGENLWFGGDKGTGKSETARQFAARTGRAYTRINFHKYTTADDYAGAVGLENGSTVFKRGDFLTAFTAPSTVILLDEVSNADQGELATLNGFLEPNSAVSYGGSVQRRANGVMVFAADNTLGNGDSTGRYAGTRQMNSALVDRFARVIKFDYLNPKDEADALMRHTKCTQELADHVVRLLTLCRAKVQSADIVDAPSIRSALGFIRALKVLSVSEAWNTTIAARQPEESHAALEALRMASIDHDLINRNI